MFNQIVFGEKLKRCRKKMNLTQEELADKTGVSGQAVSKWEKGECLPDLYNLKLLAKLYRISVDSLLEMDDVSGEKLIETIRIGGASFEIVEKSATILAGKIVYARDFPDVNAFHSALGAVSEDEKKFACGKVTGCVLPVHDITMSVNFWKSVPKRAMGFARETTEEIQPEGVDVYKMPASLYIRAYTDKNTAQLIAKEQCDIWELFAYIRNHFMPAHGFKMAENGAQELEVYDTSEHKSGYAYMPVKRN